MGARESVAVVYDVATLIALSALTSGAAIVGFVRELTRPHRWPGQ